MIAEISPQHAAPSSDQATHVNPALQGKNGKHMDLNKTLSFISYYLQLSSKPLKYIF